MSRAAVVTGVTDPAEDLTRVRDRLLGLLIEVDPAWGVMVLRDRVADVVASVPEVPSADARMVQAWEAGHRSCVCHRPGATPCRNPYARTP